MSKAGHRRAVRELVRRLAHWRCPVCRSDVRHPLGRTDGLWCPVCGTHDPAVLHFTRQHIPGGFRWVAVLTRQET